MTQDALDRFRASKGWTVGDNLQLAARMRELHGLCDQHADVPTASLLEVWIDAAERRVWFLFEASRKGDAPGA